MSVVYPEGVRVEPLAVIATPGGPVMHMLRADDPWFIGFGEVYFSEVEPGCVKAWKLHTEQTQYFTVPVGQMKVVLYDDRPESSTCGTLSEVLLGRPNHYALLRIPPKVWYGFAPVGEVVAIICNCADKSHDPAEARRKPFDAPEVPYSW